MSWNDGGNGKNNDPWGSGGDQGPPDLDEAFRKFQSQLSGLFGRRGGGASSSGGGGASRRYFMILGALILVGYFAMGIYQVDQQERGVKFTLGKVARTNEGTYAPPVMPGLNFYFPLIQNVEVVNTTKLNTNHHESLMLTEDENIVDVSLDVQWLVRDPIKHVVAIRDPENSLVQATESALRHVVGSSTLDSVVTEGRAEMGAAVQARLQERLERYETGIMVSKVNIDRSGPPPQVKDAFDDVQRAKEDESRYINQARAYSEQILPEARGNAERVVAEANAYRDQVVARSEGEAQRFSKLLAEYQLAKRVTRDRLYIESMQSVLSKSAKVMVDVKGGNNMLYLPLDQLRRQSGNEDNPASQSAVDQAADDIMQAIERNTGTSRLRRDGR
ncbi:MAG TPA: FtsH protease activity modulator HflK [Gammaproteobacteria bacterium]|nr:FtsH protease activity modulator HflK [Gammaproteobacteria bacterium]